MAILETMKRPASQSNPTTKKIKIEDEPIVTDDFGTSVEKEYAPEKNGLKAEDENLVVKHSVRHQVALPVGYPYVPLSKHVPPETPARTYPFTLDPFQQTAIYSIQREESVLVAAHTSAGKTVVAEYAIAQSLQNKQRVIYTSPIKALSNQKYRELLAEFGDVGLMTGDVTINATASCLVMTTEILRSMLYRGSDMVREVAWVIFDEVHYMRDKERGVVWEETLIMLPDKIHHVFLSATIPNAMEFAEWICKIHKQPCHVVYTDYRPTPLQHYLFPESGDGIYLAVDEKGQFREDNFQKALSFLTEPDDPTAVKQKKRTKKKKGSTDLFKVIQMIMKKNYHPVIVFSFSKRECESNALLVSKLDFNDDQEKDLVKNVFENAIQSLNEDDRSLPQIEHILPLLRRGIGIHHSGLLPILKEVIEILFQEGLIKVLFATETFSIGLNMPAKTVVFTSVRKYDGREQRWLSGGEYIQMSGRAGRRGLDERGVVILMIDEKMEPDVAKGMLKGVSDPLISAFHLTYTMLLNLMRVEGFLPEQMLDGSFHQFQNTTKIPQLLKEIDIYEARLQNIQVDKEDKISEYYQLKSQLTLYKGDVKQVLNHPTYALPFLQPGRLVNIKKAVQDKDLDFGWGIVVNFQKTYEKDQKGDLKALAQEPIYVVDVLLKCSTNTENGIRPAEKDESAEMMVVPCPLDSINGLSAIRTHIPGDLKALTNRMQMGKILREVDRRFPNGVQLLDPIKDMGIKDEEFKKLVQKIQVLEKRIENLPITSDPELQDLCDQFQAKVDLTTKINELKKQVQQAEAILQLEELKCRKRVLRRLDYISASGVIELKGRVACEISSGDELVLTEMIFNGVFNDLTVEQVPALLSCFVSDERVKQEPILQEDLVGPFKALKECAKRVLQVSVDCKLEMDEQEYLGRFRESMMPVVYAWMQGAKFSQICKLTSIFEGSIIRILRRLDELLQELVKAARSIGNTELEAKFEQASQKMKRDIVFAASLYL
ncbi:rRNA-processing arch domain-containing protein [Gorgonomyces haynaldii]|nr:rRNA-processing arch domain-containing protein [Gorgonomyces haynaldii]